MALNINGTTGISGVDGSASAPALQGTDSNTGINFGSDTVNINTGGTTRATVESNGRLGIGTTSPAQKLDVTSTSNVAYALDGYALAGKGDGNDILFGGILGSQFDTIKYYTSGTERARFISTGFLKARGNSASYHNATSNYHEIIGDTAHDVVCKLKHNSSTGYGLQTLFNHSNQHIYALSVRDYSGGSNTDKAFIRCDGDLENANNSYGGVSDIKLKENIVDAKSQWDDIKALKIRNFNYKSDVNKIKMLGLVAQEAETVCPSLVKTQPDLGEDNEELGTETKVLKYSILYMKSVKALQEAQARIETLEAENTQMKTDLTALTARVTALEAK